MRPFRARSFATGLSFADRAASFIHQSLVNSVGFQRTGRCGLQTSLVSRGGEAATKAASSAFTVLAKEMRAMTRIFGGAHAPSRAVVRASAATFLGCGKKSFSTRRRKQQPRRVACSCLD